MLFQTLCTVLSSSLVKAKTTNYEIFCYLNFVPGFFQTDCRSSSVLNVLFHLILHFELLHLLIIFVMILIGFFFLGEYIFFPYHYIL